MKSIVWPMRLMCVLVTVMVIFMSNVIFLPHTYEGNSFVVGMVPDDTLTISGNQDSVKIIAMSKEDVSFVLKLGNGQVFTSTSNFPLGQKLELLAPLGKFVMKDGSATVGIVSDKPITGRYEMNNRIKILFGVINLVMVWAMIRLWQLSNQALALSVKGDSPKES